MDTPAPLPPRIEQFCRAAARGEPLAEAARRAGYPPVSARRQASELWVRDDVQVRIGVLREAEENREQAMIGSMRSKYERMLDVYWKNGKLETASRTMAQWWRFEKDVRAQRTLTPRERERLHDEVREDLREQMRPEVAEELRAEMREEIAAKLREEIGAELRAQAGPVQTVTNHDTGRVSTPVKPAAPGRPVSFRDEPDKIEALLATADAGDAAFEAAPDAERDRPLSALDAKLREIGRTMIVRLPSSGIADD